jgi:hypothetical protein
MRADDGIRTRDPHLGKVVPLVLTPPGVAYAVLAVLVRALGRDMAGRIRKGQDVGTGTQSVTRGSGRLTIPLHGTTPCKPLT